MPYKQQLKNGLVLLISIFILACLTHLLVYKTSFIPRGYKIVSETKNKVVLENIHFFVEKSQAQSFSFSTKNQWRGAEIKRETTRQENSYWLLYTAVIISISSFIFKLRKGDGILRAIFGSNLIFAVLIPLTSLIDSVNRIHQLIS